MPSGWKKMAEAPMRIQSSPVIQYIRDKFLRVVRRSETGHIVRDTNVDCLRFPEEMCARSLPAPNLPGGLNHRLSHNAYHLRDARRAVQPPKIVSVSFKQLPSVELSAAKPSAVPLPGTPYRWTRNSQDERLHVQSDEELKYLERYD